MTRGVLGRRQRINTWSWKKWRQKTDKMCSLEKSKYKDIFVNQNLTSMNIYEYEYYGTHNFNNYYYIYIYKYIIYYI